MEAMRNKVAHEATHFDRKCRQFPLFLVKRWKKNLNRPMVFLAWFFVPQAAYLLGGVICFIVAKLRKKTFDFGRLLERYLPSLSFSFLFSLALAVMMALLFPRLSFLPSMGAFLFV